MNLCTLRSCPEHRSDPLWVTVPADTRRPAILAHLRGRHNDEERAA